MLTLFQEPYRVTSAHHNGKPYALVGFQVYQDQSLHPVLIDLEDGRLLVVGLYDVQVDVSILNRTMGLSKRQIPTPKI